MGSRSNDVPQRLVCLAAVITLSLIPLAGRAIAGQTGGTASIIGQVTDESKGVLPGVSITATSPSLQVPQVSTVTDERGDYRLTPLPIGTYVLEYSLTGFQTVRREEIRLTVGFTARVDVTLNVGQLEETVTVSGASPVVDATATAAVTQLTRETLELTPTSRNSYIGLLAQTPGARTTLDVGGDTVNQTPAFRAFGQTAESYQALDGVLTVNPKAGSGGNYVDYSTFEEATIQTIGHDASNPNRGIAINTVVKSGSNDYHGSAFYAGTSHKFQGDNIDDALRLQGITGGNSLQTRDDLSGDGGGRFIRDKLWFYFAGRVRRNIQNVLECFRPDGKPCDDYERGKFLTGKMTYQMNQSNRLLGFFQGNLRYNVRGATRLIAYEARENQESWQGSGKFEWQGTKGSSLVFSAMAGGWFNHSGDHRNYQDVDANGNKIPPTTKPATTDLVTGVVTGTRVGSGYGERNREQRTPQIRGSVSWFKPDWFYGNHEIKGGFDFFNARTNRIQLGRDSSGNYQLQFRSGVPTQIGIWNYPVRPDASVHYTGLYVSDAWTIKRKLTLNLGLRYAHDKGIIYEQCRVAADPPGDVANPAQCFPEVIVPIWNPISPRIRASYDVMGDGKTVVKGGWGRFAHWRLNEELQMSNRNVINTTTYLWHDLNNNRDYDPGEVNLDVNGSDYISTTLLGQTGALANGQVNPDETEPYTDEYMVQFERELMPNFGVRVTGAYSRALNQYRLANLKRPYESYNIPITRPDPGPDGTAGTGDETGTSVTFYDYPATLAGAAFQVPILVNDDKANQTYKTIELAASKRLANRWQFMASYSATKVNIPLVTNVGTLVINSQDPNSEIFAKDNNWEWLFKASGAYLAPWGILTSANLEHRSGNAWARTASFSTGGARIGNNITLRVEPIGSRRLPNINLLDLRFEKRFALPRRQTVSARLNIFNALNINTVLSLTQQSGSNFGKAVTIVAPRILEFSAQYTF